MADTISDFLTVIRNASAAGLERCEGRHSRVLEDVTRILQAEGYVRSYEVVDLGGNRRRLRVELKYVDRAPAITSLVRVSSPGRRVYHKATELPRVLGGLGISIVTTSRGILSDREARRQGVGGEVICKVW